MPTSVHIPKQLLDAVDKRARALKLSRNRFIVSALEKEISGRGEWAPGFFERLEQADDELRSAVDELQAVVRKARSSKGPPTI
jgi:hypothetical protein